jgi:hypothetical protein
LTIVAGHPGPPGIPGRYGQPGICSTNCYYAKIESSSSSATTFENFVTENVPAEDNNVYVKSTMPKVVSDGEEITSTGVQPQPQHPSVFDYDSISVVATAPDTPEAGVDDDEGASSSFASDGRGMCICVCMLKVGKI